MRTAGYAEGRFDLIACAGPHTGEIDRAYGLLATYVTDHALATDGTIREYYVIGPHETNDENQWHRNRLANLPHQPTHNQAKNQHSNTRK